MKNIFSLLTAVSLAAANTSFADAPTTTPITPPIFAASKAPIRAIHVTAWQAGSSKYRHMLDEKVFGQTSVNAVAIDIKEYQGEVYIPGAKMATEANAYVPAMPDIQKWVTDLKGRHIYTIARMVTFKDNIMPRHDNSLGVHDADGKLWADHHQVTWLDPYNQNAWHYNLEIAEQAGRLGFDEVQFDYIRFPTDGSLKTMHFAKPYSRDAALHALVTFLGRASALLHPMGVAVSIDVFGLTTSVSTGMGIGQVMRPMADQVDFVCPMVYPSHYAKGEYGIPNPNDDPYKTIHLAMHDALKALGPDNAYKLRPYLQDFSLKGRGIRYGEKEVREQINAAGDQNVGSWTLWNASCKYTWAALKATPLTDLQPKSAQAMPMTTPAFSAVSKP